MTAIVVRHENVLSIFEIPIGEAADASNSISWTQCVLLAGLGSSDAKACELSLIRAQFALLTGLGSGTIRSTDRAR